MSGQPAGGGHDDTGHDDTGHDDAGQAAGGGAGPGASGPGRGTPLPRGRPRMSVRIGPDAVGERVSVRFRLPEPEPDGPTESEAVGWLRDWRDGVLTIERRDGTHAVIDEGDLVAGRAVPPPPPRRKPR